VIVRFLREAAHVAFKESGTLRVYRAWRQTDLNNNSMKKKEKKVGGF
jgi:hypothetical protein